MPDDLMFVCLFVLGLGVVVSHKSHLLFLPENHNFQKSLVVSIPSMIVLTEHSVRPNCSAELLLFVCFSFDWPGCIEHIFFYFSGYFNPSSNTQDT